MWRNAGRADDVARQSERGEPRHDEVIFREIGDARRRAYRDGSIPMHHDVGASGDRPKIHEGARRGEPLVNRDE